MTHQPCLQMAFGLSAFFFVSMLLVHVMAVSSSLQAQVFVVPGLFLNIITNFLSLRVTVWVLSRPSQSGNTSELLVLTD